MSLRIAAAACLLFAGSATASGAGSSAVTPSTRLIADLLETVEAEPADCPDGLDAYGTTQEAVCAVSGLPGKALKRKLRSILRNDDDAVRLPGMLWSTRHEYEVARLFVGRELLIVRYDPRDGGLALLPHQSCFRPATLAGAGVMTDRAAGVEAPNLLELPGPDYPEPARIERRSGFVMVQAIVGTDGTVLRSCVLFAAPEGLGFREAALEAVGDARYEPGRHEGDPAAVLVNEAVTWELR